MNIQIKLQSHAFSFVKSSLPGPGEIFDNMKKSILDYFSANPNKNLNNTFRKRGFFAFKSRNAIYNFHEEHPDRIKLYFEERTEYHNQPIIENGKVTGHIRLAIPHTIEINKGIVLCKEVRKLKQKEVVKKWRWNDVKIRKSFWPWSKQLIVRINNNGLNIVIKCATVTPYAHSFETVYPELLSWSKTTNPGQNANINDGNEETFEQSNSDEINIKPSLNFKGPVEPKELETIQESDHDETSDELFTRYSHLKLSSQTDPWKYPLIRIPKKGCIVRSYRTGSTKRRGYKESSFQKSLDKTIGNQIKILGDIRLNTGNETRPYEPDIALADETSGLNIRIDIEIDEPYAGITRQATHCIEEDDLRDIFFVDRGWTVIRFTEHQIHIQENECLAYVARFIHEINPSFQIPSELKGIEDPRPENQWSVLQAQKWECKIWYDNDIIKRGWREEYLNHEFISIPQVGETQDKGLNVQELKEEMHVKRRVTGKIVSTTGTGFNVQNRHSRDNRIQFEPQKHNYTIDGVPATAVSTIIEKMFPVFDTDAAILKMRNGRSWGTDHKYFNMTDKEIKAEWKNSGADAAQSGTYLHEQIEKYFNGLPYESPPEFSHFMSFINQHSALKAYRTEWRIFDEKKLIAGTIDFISKNGSGFDIYDWKRSKKIVTSDGDPIRNGWESGIGILDQLDNTSFNKYCLQQNFYKLILEENYGIKINDMFLIVLHPEYNRFYKVKIPHMKHEIKTLYRSL